MLFEEFQPCFSSQLNRDFRGLPTVFFERRRPQSRLRIFTEWIVRKTLNSESGKAPKAHSPNLTPSGYAPRLTYGCFQLRRNRWPQLERKDLDGAFSFDQRVTSQRPDRALPSRTSAPSAFNSTTMRSALRLDIPSSSANAATPPFGFSAKYERALSLLTSRRSAGRVQRVRIFCMQAAYCPFLLRDVRSSSSTQTCGTRIYLV